MPCFIKSDIHHSRLCSMPWLCDGCLLCCLLLSGVLLRVGSDNVVWWGFVRLRPFVFFMDSFFFLAGFQARWPYPRNHFYLCLLVARSFAMPMLWCLPLAYHASHIVWTRPLTHLVLANHCFCYVTALLSPSNSVVSCRWRLKFVPCWNMEMLFLVGTCLLVGISLYILFN